MWFPHSPVFVAISLSLISERRKGGREGRGRARGPPLASRTNLRPEPSKRPGSGMTSAIRYVLPFVSNKATGGAGCRRPPPLPLTAFVAPFLSASIMCRRQKQHKKIRRQASCTAVPPLLLSQCLQLPKTKRIEPSPPGSAMSQTVTRPSRKRGGCSPSSTVWVMHTRGSGDKWGPPPRRDGRTAANGAKSYAQNL